MNIEHLVEPKIKDLERQIENLRHLNDIDHMIDGVEYEYKHSGVHYGFPTLPHASGSVIVQRLSGPYLINFQIQKL